MTTGSNNTVHGSATTGNQGGLDIRTSSNNIVLSDGDGNPRVQLLMTVLATLHLVQVLPRTCTTNPGVAFLHSGYIFAGKSSDAPIYANRITNDGAVIVINQDGTTVGTIICIRHNRILKRRSFISLVTPR